MQTKNQEDLFAQWKERARMILGKLTEEALRRGSSRNLAKGSLDRKTLTFVYDPISIRVEDMYGGVFQCTYDISRTLTALSEQFQNLKLFDDDEIDAYAQQNNISLDEAMLRVALRHVEGDISSKVKAGKFLHNQLQPAVKQMLRELLDEAFLNGVREYSVELVAPTETFEKIGREHVKHIKSRSGLVPRVGRPESWPKEKLLVRVRSEVLRQKRLPTLASTAATMNYGGQRGGASALGKLLKRHSIEWKTLTNEWKIQNGHKS